MTELSTTEAKLIEQAAEKYGKECGFQTSGYYDTEQDCANSFAAGASFATTDPLILQAMLQPFAEWIRTFEALERQNGQWVIESQLSDEQIVKAFIADNKQKEDDKGKPH